MRRLALVGAVTLCAVAGTGRPASAAGTWFWPVAGPIVVAYDPPETPYGSGHRGIDIGAEPGTVAVAPADGVIAFAGPVAGHLFLTIDHGGGLTSTFSWVSELLVRRGDAVTGGQPVARTGWAHPGGALGPMLHFGVRLDGAYQDPLAYLSAPDVTGLIRLAPW